MDRMPEVRNAGDRRQVQDAERRLRRRRGRWLAALRAVLATPEGRLVFGERDHGLLAKAGVYRSIWAPNAQIHYNAGRQDYGHELMAELLRADERAYLLMEQEARAIAAGDERETEAAHTAPAGETE